MADTPAASRGWECVNVGGIVSHFLLLRDQAVYKRRFEEIKGKKSNPSFPLYDF